MTKEERLQKYIDEHASFTFTDDPNSARQALRKWRANNPLKVKAHRIVFVALRNGSLQRQPCHCGDTKVHAHHTDYSKPLDVLWLCKKHHVEIHKKDKEYVTETKSKQWTR